MSPLGLKEKGFVRRGEKIKDDFCRETREVEKALFRYDVFETSMLPCKQYIVVVFSELFDQNGPFSCVKAPIIYIYCLLVHFVQRCV